MFKQNEGREIRTPNLLIWSQTRCRCAIPPLLASATQKYWFAEFRQAENFACDRMVGMRVCIKLAAAKSKLQHIEWKYPLAH